MSPTTLQDQFAKVLSRPIDNIQQLQGGCSYPSFVVTSNNSQFFVKTNEQGGKVFETEAHGLLELNKYSHLIPELVHFEEKFLVLEYISPEPPQKKFWENLGVELAKMHRKTGKAFGFSEDNFIGLSTQKNICSQGISWSQFFWQNRLLFKIKQLPTGASQFWTEERINNLKQNVESRLADQDYHPSPCHGDLWSGNIICGPNQKPILVDPAFYYGVNEADLAMTECFGGFEPRFYQAYGEVFPLSDGYHTLKHLYNLYHMLNHQVIFGDHYQTAVAGILEKLQFN